MTFAEAVEIVRPFIIKHHQYSVVSHADAAKLLGTEKFARIKKDPIRGVGPAAEMFYFWNIADYLAMA